MKSLNGILLFLIVGCIILQSVQAQDQSGFISLDCGFIPKNTTYTEKITNITYQADADYIDSGVIGRIKDAYKQQYQQQTYTLRSFPEGQRNCYNFNLKANSKYLIRGTFLYGDYDGWSTVPRFDLHIGPNKWTSVILDSIGQPSIYELIHVLTQDLLRVCLVKIDKTTPFISSLELRPMNNYTYVTQSGSLNALDRRYSPHNTDASFLRYDEDFNDRIWFPFHENDTMSLSTDLQVDTSSNSYNVPQNVAKSGVIPKNATCPLSMRCTKDVNVQLYIYMHFAELQNLEPNETREFNFTFNGEVVESFVRPHNLSITTITTQTPLSSTDGIFSFALIKTEKSTHPPLLNGVELYSVVENSLLETYQDEVSAMMNIKKTYGLTKKISWQGDPCSPQTYRWEGVNCIYLDSDQPLITSLNLASSGLTGTITPSIANLIQLKTLDLSKNDLSGDIPSFLADMKMLTLINLSGNPKLNLTIPDSLMQRINNKSLTLIVDASQIPNVKNTSRRIPWEAIGNSVAGVVALLVVCKICFIIAMKKKKSEEAFGRIDDSEKTSSSLSIETRDRKFTYSEILKMTNNFERVLGKGGYGRVYYGDVDGIQVAVKMLFHSAAHQDYKHFKAEVELLLRVHHRHLVGIVGYCDDGDNLGLIYEYMANGDLKENMSGKRGHVLTWENRVQIAMEAAQGLEYLHNGSIPPMVHRDVKSTNILLNERFQAKIADFGLSRSSPVDGESYISTVVAGTPGYLDPEYYRTNLLSEKSDVYSFGVVLLEIITNKPVIDITREGAHITEWVGFMLMEGDIRSIIDPKLMEDFDSNGVWKAVELAMACVNPISNRRPSMAYVVMELNECLDSEIARKQGSQEMYTKDSVELCLSPDSIFSPGPR